MIFDEPREGYLNHAVSEVYRAFNADLRNDSAIAAIRKKGGLEASSAVIERKREMAQERGLLVHSVEEMRDLHPELKFSRLSNGFMDIRNIEAYVGVAKGARIAYCKCATCQGLVFGEPLGKHYSSIESLSGSEGTRYHCSICDSFLGSAISSCS